MPIFSNIPLIFSTGLLAGIWAFGAGDLRAEETGEGGIAGRVARVVSPEMRRIEARLGELARELDELPQLRATPLAERYGFRSATLYDQDESQWVQLDLGRQQKIDRIVAVPTHIPRFGKKGEGYGFPLRFRIEVAENPEMERAVTVVDRTAEDVENPGRHHGRTKHLDVHLRWIEREYERERLALVYVNTEFMVADVLTKALAYERHARHTSAMKGHKMPEKEKKAPKKRTVAFEETDQMES